MGFFQFSSQSFSHSQMYLLCRNFGLVILENSESTNTMVITGPDHSKWKMQIAGFKFHLCFGAELRKINSGIILNKKLTVLRTRATIFHLQTVWNSHSLIRHCTQCLTSEYKLG